MKERIDDMQDNNDYYISTEAIYDIRSLTIRHSRGLFPAYLLGILIFYLFTEVVPSVLGLFFPRSYFDLLTVPDTVAAQMPYIPYAVFVYSLFLTGVFVLGRTLFAMYFLRNRMLDYNLTFDGFSHYFRATLLYLFQTVAVTIASMAFVAPGIVLFYSYRQAFYLLAEDPNRGPIQCLRESRRMMRGNKMQLFRLDVSYLFNLVAAYIPQYVAAYFFTIDPAKASGVAVITLLSVPVYLVVGNMILGQTVFYEILHSHGFRNFRYAGEEVFREADEH